METDPAPNGDRVQSCRIDRDVVSIPLIRSLGLLHGGVDQAGRDEPALHQEVTRVFERYREPIFRYAYGVLQDAAEAEDTAQEAFLRYYREVKKGREIAPRAWLFRVAHNLAIDRLRARSQCTTLAEERWSDLGETRCDDRLDVHADVLRQERRRKLAAVTAELSGRERHCIALRLEGLRYREIAGVLGVGISSVENYLARAVRKIMREFDA